MIILDFIIILLIWLITLLPLRILYILSDLLYYLLYYIIRYRKSVVYTNLRSSFPEKSEEEIRKIAKKFYKNLSDIIIEVLKLRHMSVDQLKKRVVVQNRELIDRYYKANKKVIISTAHIGNWEWIGTITPALFDYKVYLVYKPLSNKTFNDYLLRLRSKCGLNFIPFLQTYRYLIKNKDEISMTIVASDQSPTRSEIGYWARFLNQDTGFFIGAEKISKSLDCVVVFVDIVRVKRGHYFASLTDISDNPKDTNEFEITEKYVRMLEKHIIENPDNWLWSHKRWKHKKQ
jgi:Kdo2-lipid IVA lauroyltransferase/acyltransferase